MTTIHIGNQSAQSAQNLWAPFDYAISNGFDAFEWFSDKKFHADGSSNGWDENDLDNTARGHIRYRAQQAGMKLSVHAPWQANPLQLDGNALLMRSVDFARDIGAGIVNLHLYMSNGAAGYVSALRPVLAYARERDIGITIENTVHTTPAEFNDVFELLALQPEFDAKKVGMCLDIGHANLCCETHNDFIKYIDQLRPHVPILHVHAHENFGDADSHLALFTGPSAKNDSGIRLFLERMLARKFDGAIILEQWPNPAQLLVDARARLRAMLSVLQNASVKAPEVPVAPIEAPKPTPKIETKPPEPPPVEAKPAAAVVKAEPKKEKAPREEKKKDAPAPSPLPSAAQAGVDELFSSIPVPKRSQRPAVKKAAPEAKPVPRVSPPVDLSNVRDPFIRALAENHGQQKSWRARLQWVRDRFCNSSTTPLTGDLATVAIYLRFLSTGEAPCEEDGGHFRPNHHAQAAEQIETALEKLTTKENAWIVRRIRPYLPSFDAEFRRAEPLTRIRDIAHRNDIPRELKEEIKHTLQNKLHRCAGPEDLRTSAAILERISAPNASFPPAFVTEFHLFHAELSAFFNAAPLEERLLSLATHLVPAENEAMQIFLKRRTLETKSVADQLLVLTQAQNLRDICAKPSTSTAERVRRERADSALEELAFVQLSETYNSLPNARFGEDQGWLALIKAIRAAAANVRQSHIQAEECAAVEQELQAWMKSFDAADRLHLLRLKASFERAQRIAGNFADEALELFHPRATELGKALGVEAKAVQVFVEGDLRASVVFQLSKLAERGVQQLRHALDLPAWESVVPGEAFGTLAAAHSLSAFDPHSGSFIVALESAEGDEEIPACVRGIVLAHALPHLSHLCVRARQARVPFALTDDKDEFSDAVLLAGRKVSLRVTADAVKVREAGSESNAKAAAAVIPEIPEADLSSAGKTTAIESVPPSIAGGKAAAAGKLRALAKESRGLFQVPRGVVLPFGSLEDVLSRAPSMSASYTELGRIIAASDGAPLLAAIGEIRGLVASLDIPDEWIRAICSQFDQHARLAVRSSANGEDLEQLAGAGLYESLLNVKPTDVPEAIRHVWASVWTPRAVRSRAQCRIPHEKIKMAVLVQELIDAEYSFIMHTTDVLQKDPAWATVELCAGLGETLASAGEPGSPYRLRCGRKSGEVRVESCASFSCALRSAPDGGTIRARLDYSKVGLSSDGAAVKQIGLRLARLAEYLETNLGGPQDVEGVIRGGILCVVQARPQQGL